eukprot:COSAG02_NODE_341_length_24173_cov_28.504777_27_plen_66_part_00
MDGYSGQKAALLQKSALVPIRHQVHHNLRHRPVLVPLRLTAASTAPATVAYVSAMLLGQETAAKH